MDPETILTTTPVPPLQVTVAWLRAMVARFSTGEDHTRRRALVLEELARIQPQALQEAASPKQPPVATLAQALGYAVNPEDVREIAKAYQPHFPQTPEADQACARLVQALGGTPDERTAAKIGILVQACDATEALIKNTHPPVPTTRRWVDGAEVAVDLRDHPFGAGPHACPGEDHAKALAQGALNNTRR
ncbi:oxidoreductase [Amycolatopsis rhabdoformis]|uniref:Oxidoreductase n=1 Tax=Amycolatopsis rhabdoformis TaxID=1448059 RepID=A0ABZ1HZN2_9PSEU|nr:oxidoreductase [Amycolatopsis rhabdoformis]WSE27425.1 oxidoreductase [Amycolatopsis rhabdoformis]